MKIKDTLFQEVKILSFKEKDDVRGSMSVTFDEKELKMVGIDFRCKEQRVYSMPNKGTFFGIHFQLNRYSQDKIIYLIAGRGIDYVVDLRKSSDTYKKWISIELSGNDNQFVYIPQGFGHAFLSLEDHTIQMFTINEHFHPGESKQINYKDTQIKLELPIDVVAISEGDRMAPFLDEEGYDV